MRRFCPRRPEQTLASEGGGQGESREREAWPLAVAAASERGRPEPRPGELAPQLRAFPGQKAGFAPRERPRRAAARGAAPHPVWDAEVNAGACGCRRPPGLSERDKFDRGGGGLSRLSRRPQTGPEHGKNADYGVTLILSRGVTSVSSARAPRRRFPAFPCRSRGGDPSEGGVQRRKGAVTASTA